MKNENCKTRRRRGEKAISTVIGSVLAFVILTATTSVLFATLSIFNKDSQTMLQIEETRTQEKLSLISLITNDQSEISGIQLRNQGSVSTRIRAIYIDDKFICDPSKYMATEINAHESLSLQLIPATLYVPMSKLCLTTERATKAVEYEWVLKGDVPQTYEGPTSNFGPLQLNYEEFYYANCKPDGTYPETSWNYGWNALPDNDGLVWKISVNNTDNRDITLTKYSCFTLVPVPGGPASQTPWYIEIDKISHKDGTCSPTIEAQETYVTIFYRYYTPLVGRQNINYPSGTQSKVFLTFFGFFHEPGGYTKPYGQTIPFEAVSNQ